MAMAFFKILPIPLITLLQLLLVASAFAIPAGLSPQSRSSPSLRSRSDSISPNVYTTRFPNVTWDSDEWQLSTTNLDQGIYQSRMSVANGYIGINVAALGPFFEVESPVNGDGVNDWPLFQRRQTFATVGGFFSSSSGSHISGVPHWGAIGLLFGNGQLLNAATPSSQITNFVSTLDIKAGTMNWAFTWTPDGSIGSFDITYQIFAHKLYVNQAFVQMSITASSNTEAKILNILEGSCAVRTTFTKSGTDSAMIYSAVNPEGVMSVTAFVYAGLQGTSGFDQSSGTTVTDAPGVTQNASSIVQEFSASLTAGQTLNITKFIGIASSDGFSDPQSVARNATQQAMQTGYESSLLAHTSEWATILTTDSVDDYTFPQNGSLPNDDYIVEQAINAVATPYYLLQNTIGANALEATNGATVNQHSISVAGLGSDSYAGMIFWDAETWMQPGLAAAFPEAVQGIAAYRSALFGQAQQNVHASSISFSAGSAVFPWTSGRYGGCDEGQCFNYEYHISGDIAQELANYWVVSGDTATFKQSYFPIYDAIALFYSEILTQQGSQFALNDMTDPDEYANGVSNGGYTMPLIANTLTNANKFREMFGMNTNSEWTTISENLIISRNGDANIILEYTGMKGTIAVKQADVVLDTFPLSYQVNYTAQDSFDDLNYYAAKQSPDGPGMTYAIFSIVANDVSTSGCSSYTYQQYSSQPYVRAPWFQFSEQIDDDYSTNGGTHPAFPFLTGHGGAYQVVLFGYLGLRLIPDFNLHVNPSLPPQIPQLKFRNFYWQGWPISAFSNTTHTTLTRLATPYITANMTYENTAIPVVVGSDTEAGATYSLAPSSTITLPNRQIGQNPTVPGNLFQCSSVTSPSTYLPGQFPLAAIDGSASTKWQPTSANDYAKITVAIPPGGKPITSVYFDWGSMPPKTFSVVLQNTSDPNASGGIEIASDSQVKISIPYDSSTAADIKPPTRNTSSYSVQSGLYPAEYAVLTIRGNQAYGSSDADAYNPSAAGGTVAEFALLALAST